MPAGHALDRETIVAAAVRILERDGADGLSMRRLAVELGSKPMTLYHYVPNKSALLSLALSAIADRIGWQPPTGDPRERMIGIAVDMYTKLREIPWIVGILREGTNVGTPALALADQFLEAALQAGLDDREALSLWRSVWFLVASQLQWERSLTQRSADQQSWFEAIDPEDLGHAPTVARLLPRWGELSAGYDIRAAISDQIDGTLGRTPG